MSDEMEPAIDPFPKFSPADAQIRNLTYAILARAYEFNDKLGKIEPGGYRAMMACRRVFESDVYGLLKGAFGHVGEAIDSLYELLVEKTMADNTRVIVSGPENKEGKRMVEEDDSYSYSERLGRVRLMADGDDTWDLSDNDMLALRAVLDRLDLLEKERGK